MYLCVTFFVKRGKRANLDQQEVINFYLAGFGCPTIGKHYKVTSKAIADILHKNDISLRSPINGDYHKYNLNEHFFDEINTEAQAYFLGLMFADGYVYDKTNTVGISLQEQDKKILLIFSNIIYNKDVTKYIKKRDFNASPQYRLSFYSREIKAALIKHGCVPNKSLILKPPIGVPDHLTHHFIRGYFDGDGHMGKKAISFVSTIEMCQWIGNVIKKQAKINKVGYYQMYNKKTYSVVVHGKENRKNLCDYLYKDATIYIQRKYKNRSE